MFGRSHWYVSVCLALAQVLAACVATPAPQAPPATEATQPAASSQPSTSWYPVGMDAEKMNLTITTGEVIETEPQMGFAPEQVDEMQQLADDGQDNACPNGNCDPVRGHDDGCSGGACDPVNDRDRDGVCDGGSCGDGQVGACPGDNCGGDLGDGCPGGDCGGGQGDGCGGCNCDGGRGGGGRH